jgi:putative ABC transport system ATP-binding protein
MTSKPAGTSTLRISGLTKRYGPTAVLDIAEFTMNPGEQVVLSGPSGSGKTTFLNIIAGMATPTSGSVIVAGRDIARLPEPERDRFRAGHIGYIFQSFNLLPAFTALENVELGGTFAGGKGAGGADRARALLERVGLAHRASHRPREMSVGEQQRVAVARALINRPPIVLADEPTANLDAATADEVIDLIRRVCADEGSALLLVTHDPRVMERFEDVRDFRGINKGGGA